MKKTFSNFARLFRTSSRKRRRSNNVVAQLEVLEPKQLLSATTTPTARLNTEGKIALHAGIHDQVDAGQADILFIGDSITQRWNDQGAEPFEHFFGDHDTINMGIGGDATQSVLWRLQDYDLANISPEVIVLNVGTNNICHPSAGTCTGEDTPEDTAAGIEANVNYLRSALPNAHIILLGVLPRGQFAGDDHRQPIIETNALIDGLGDNDEFVHYMDLGDLFLESDGQISSDVMFDYLHLTETGYNRLATAIAPTVEGLVNGNGTPIVLEGTSGNDTFRFIAHGDTYQVAVNGQLQTFASSHVNFHFNGNGGTDVVKFEGNSGDDTVAVGVDSIYLAGDGYVVTASDVDNKTILGGGGDDSAYVYDSEGDDRFIGKPGLAYITGPGLYSAVVGFEHVTGFSSDGFDLADLYDSPADDIVINNPTEVTLQDVDATFDSTVKDFNYVRSTAYLGGYDQANFYDSVNDDYFIARPDNAYMRDADSTYLNYVKGFEAKRAFSTAGGDDEAQFYDSKNDDYFIAKPTIAYMQNNPNDTDGEYFYNVAEGFNRNIAYAINGGYDEAQFYDSADDDRLQAKKTYAYIYSGLTYLNFGSGFDKVLAIGNGGGYDRLDQESDLNYAFTRYNEWEELHDI